MVDSISELRAALENTGRTIGLVPTMGALHEGHGRLIEQARSESDCVVVSIFVNPIQFNQTQDCERYPRPLEADLRFCEQRQVDLVFAPTATEMYPQPQRAFVEVGGVTDHLCGKFRPGHFRGVATVVLKLFEIVRPNRAYFGEKDFQQLVVIRTLVADLNFPVTVVGVPTVREPDGLALSSRNRLLNSDERQAAPVLYRALEAARRSIEQGARDAGQIKNESAAIIAREPGVSIEYLEIVDPGTIQPVSLITGPVRIAGAIWVGATRLIDNVA